MHERYLECCVCGERAGLWKQHWNRDIGYGICGDCAANQAAKLPADEMQSLYGVAGLNYEASPTKGDQS